MPRPRRIDVPGARYHVMNRGARRQPIFTSDLHCDAFVRGLAALPERFGVEVHGYALMPNHFHLMLRTPRGGLSLAMGHLTARFTRWLNQQHGWDGPVFRGRFHSRRVQDGAHWRHLLAYLHLNPVRAGLARTVEQTHWTSHSAYVGASTCPEWLTTADLLTTFGSVAAYTRYLAGLRTHRLEPPEGFAHVAMQPYARASGPPVAPAEAPPLLGVDAIAALERLCAVTGCTPDELRETRRGRRGHAARRLAAYWLVYGAGLRVVDAGRLLAMHPVRASQAVSAVHTHRGLPTQQNEWIQQLENWPEKSLNASS
jgi:REP element-mobilizing transposase RayT